MKPVRFFLLCAKRILAVLGIFFQSLPKSIRIFSDSGAHIFFGYYDITPFSKDNNFLLATRVHTTNASPHFDHPVMQVGFYNIREKNPTFVEIGSTYSWNWQQGCRLQWLRNSDHESFVIYNKTSETNYISVVQDIKSGKIVKTIPLPIYSISHDGSFALTLDFNKLHQYRQGYGYNNFPQSNALNGIIYIDLETGDYKTILTERKAAAFSPLISMKNAEHYFNHLSISPNGTRYMVTHLWTDKNGKRFSRIIIGNFSNEILYVPNNSGHTSHYCWVDDTKIIVFSENKKGILVYQLYDLGNKSAIEIGSSILKGDGHPSSLSALKIITDTYPDRLGLQTLLIYDESRKQKRVIGRFHSPISYRGEVRCDLHPRLSNDHKLVCIDSVKNDKRIMVTIQLS